MRSRDTFTSDMLDLALDEAMRKMPWDCGVEPLPLLDQDQSGLSNVATP